MDEEEYAWMIIWVEKVNTAIDAEIEKYGTLLHGDVKGANIVFNRDPYSSSRKGTNSSSSGHTYAGGRSDPVIHGGFVPLRDASGRYTPPVRSLRFSVCRM